jgi:agmatinase
MHLPFQYGSTRNFCGIPNYTTQEFVIVGCPLDGATTFRSGARMGPNAIRNSSMMLIDGMHDEFPVNLIDYVGDAGDIAIPSGNTDTALKTIENHYFSFRKKHIVVLGGDHSCTLGILRALKKTYDNIGVLHFDAHCDTWKNHFGEKYGHGTWLYNACEENLINPSRTVSIGLRSPADEESREYLKRKGGYSISAKQAMFRSPTVLADQIREVMNGYPVYLSLDIDCIDPAFAPGTGTPEIGGLSTIWMRDLIDELGKNVSKRTRLDWIGMDCVEVAPAYDHSDITSLAAATFCWQYLSQVIHTAVK